MPRFEMWAPVGLILLLHRFLSPQTHHLCQQHLFSADHKHGQCHYPARPICWPPFLQPGPHDEARGGQWAFGPLVFCSLAFAVLFPRRLPSHWALGCMKFNRTLEGHPLCCCCHNLSSSGPKKEATPAILGDSSTLCAYVCY